MSTATAWQRDRTNPDRPYGIEMTVAPSGALYAVSLSDTKDWLNIPTGDTSHDTKILALIRAATTFFQDATLHQCLNATFSLILDGFPNNPFDNHAILLPRAPVYSLTSIRYIDTDGSTQTLASSNYEVLTTHNPSKIIPVQDFVWPPTRAQDGVVTALFVAGYGNSTDDVPDLIQTGIKMIVAHWFENPEPLNIGNIVSDIPMSVMSIIQDYRLRL